MSAANGWPEILERDGEVRVVGGNTPFFLDDPRSAYLVAAGKIEVFSVSREAGAAKGPRRHFCSVDAGGVMLGMDLDAYGDGLGFLAVGVVGTRIVRAPVERLEALARQAEHAEGVAEAIDGWASGLSAGAARAIVPRPRADSQLDPEKSYSLAAGKRARPRKQLLWVKHASGTTLFLGMEEVPRAGEAPFPLAPEAWLQASDASKLETLSTEQALAGGRAFAGMHGLFEAILRCEFFNSRLAAVDELNRLKEKAVRDLRAREHSLLDVASVLSQRPPEAPRVESDEPLLASAILVGHQLGIKIQPPPKPKGDETGSSDPLLEIVRASRIRSRRVVLKGEWWRSDGGPFIAYLDAGKQPVALLTDEPGSYELHEPATGRRRPVTPEVAAELAGEAHVLYRPFPDGKLDPAKLLRFAASACSQDLKLPILMGIGAGVLGMATPFFMGMLVDRVIPEAAQNQLIQLSFVLLVVGVVTTMFDAVRNLSLLRIETKMSSTIQPAMWDRLLSLPTRFFRKYSSGDLANRAMGIDAMRRILSGATLMGVMNGIFGSFNYALLFWYSWKLALVATGVTLVAVSATSFAGWLKMRQQRTVMEVEGKISGLVLQLLAGMAKLRVTGAELRAFSVWAKEFAQQKRLAFKVGNVDKGLEVFNSAFPVLSSMAIFFALQWLLKEDVLAGGRPLSAGDFIGFNSAFGIFLSETLQMGTALMSVLVVVPLFERAKPILEAEPEVDTSKVDPGQLSGRVEVSHVSFRYHEDGPLILDDVSLEIEAGQFVALVGPSGSGKSTLLRVLLGLETPETGVVHYDGRDLATLDVQMLRRKIGVVTQLGAIRAGSIYANIVGSLPLSVDDAWEAARMAGFDEDVKQMPMGMHTVLQQGGATLSGGQRQRLMIARAIVSRPRVLYFDEATSALDNRTQAIVSKSLEQLQSTRIAVAHRLTTIMGADRIYVLQNGRLAQAGSYRELAEQPGLFQELIRRQIA